MGLVDEDNQEAAMQEIGQRQQAMAPEIPGGPAPAAGGEGPVGVPDLNTPLTPDTFTPPRINLAQ